MPEEKEVLSSVRFGRFELSVDTGELRKDGARLKVYGQAIQVLKTLVASPGKLVTREELQQKLWPGASYGDPEHGLNAAVNKLRETLGDSATEPKYIETVPGRGYRFIGKLEGLNGEIGPGKTVSHYRILEIIGRGGMGVVYKAQDVRLGRNVAVKFLPRELATNNEALERFRREASTASSLNHPNICTIYDVEELEEQPFIVMELLLGQTLRDFLIARALGRNRLELVLNTDQLLDIALQILEGLQAAHEKGVIHRDIKPANIFLTEGRLVKILDFGLAKLIATVCPNEIETLGPQGDVLPDAGLSKIGAVIGSPGYMSPEQARGEHLDGRADLFSFGLVLYEMATGRPAFDGTTADELCRAILSKTPTPVRELNPSIPPALEQLINKAVEKNRDLRYQSASDLRAGLVRARAEVAANLPPQSAPSKPPWWKRKATIAVVACIVAGALLYPWLAPQVESYWRLRELQQLTVVPLTSLPGYVWSPTFSPDGSQIAFLWEGNNPNGNSDLYVKLIGNDTSLRLTDGAFQINAAAWSPDGKNIAICRWTSEGLAVFLISPLGGPLRKVSSEPCRSRYGGSLSWSPDGKHLVFPYLPNKSSFLESHLFVLDTDNMDGARVKTDCNEVITAAYSPTGDYLAWICSENLDNFSVYLQRLSDGTISQLLTGTGGPRGSSLAWSSDSRRIVYSSSAKGSDLWELALARPNISEKLPFGHDVTQVAVSPRSNRLALTETHTNKNIWRVDLLHPQAKAERAVASSREQTAPDFSPDGTQITFQSNRSGPTEIWVSGADGSNAMKLSSFGIMNTGTPQWSPDGKLIAFDSRSGGEANIYLVEPQGGVPHKLNIDVQGNSQPSWSHDGKRIYFVNGDDVHRPRVWKVPSQGGHAVQISQGDSLTPRESPDGHYVYFARSNRLWRVKTDGTEEQQVANMPILGQGEAWCLVGSGIYFLGDRLEIDFFDLNTKETHHIFTPEKRPNGDWMGGLPVSRDGRWLLYAQIDEESSNLMLVENWR